ncbi:streptomycin adenylyltransferase [Stackebrandtia endophytica]|uniref:Streptomycin adenylyltransferase n=1 Tax=Stackebrandtia endophytica TaxID=1496996 RepID=A0A543AS92_9ACTN|nr:streptomycin adenylyltransferase [Stackebrandtia endophytica]
MDREVLIQRVSDQLQADDRIRGAWLSGSLARGTADEFSDVDVWLVVAESEREALIKDWPTICDAITPTVLNQRVGSLPIFNAITPQWHRFDVVFGTPEEIPYRTRTTLKVLFDKDGLDDRLQDSGQPLAPDPARIRALVTEFFRVLGLLPVAIGRGEYVLGVSGAGLLRTMLIQLMLEDVAVEDRGGALHLSPLLPPERMRLLTELPAMSADRDSVVAVHVACAEAFLPLGRELAERTGVEWPTALDEACRARLNRDLGISLADS